MGFAAFGTKNLQKHPNTIIINIHFQDIKPNLISELKQSKMFLVQQQWWQKIEFIGDHFVSIEAKI